LGATEEGGEERLEIGEEFHGFRFPDEPRKRSRH
jgi:hypothetical protein